MYEIAIAYNTLIVVVLIETFLHPLIMSVEFYQCTKVVVFVMNEFL